jgi:GT2 family glycosyltransferase
MDISFVIVNWNTRDLLLGCLSAIDRLATGIAYEIIIVDNGSSDGSVKAVQKRFPAARCIVNQENRGFGAANNQAFEVMRGRYALLINTDATLQSGALNELLVFMRTHRQAAMACGQLFNCDGSKQNSFAAFPSLPGLFFNESLLRLLYPGKFQSKSRGQAVPVKVDSCIGACVIVRKQAIDQVGGFDERYFFFLEETDWARRFWLNGWQIYFVPSAHVVHAQGQSAGSGAHARKLFYYARLQYLRKWHAKHYPLFKAVIAGRLAVNTAFNFVAFVLTLGSHRNTRLRFSRYCELLRWHLNGCPFPAEPEKPVAEKGHG